MNVPMRRGVPVARLAPTPMSGTDGGYPWVDGELLYAADLNAAIGGGGAVGAINPITGTYGIQSFPSTDIYQSPDSYALTGSMTVRGQPYGYYDTGTLLSLVSTTAPLSSSRAGVNGGFEAGVPAIAAYGSLDLVTLYNSIMPCQPPLVLHNVTYDATHVYPQVPLTAPQMQALRKNMWVLTNSIDTSVSATPSVPGGLPPETHYASFVTGWASDGTSISVVGWTVPGSGHAAAGQVPSSTLAPGSANATAYFGAQTSAFGANCMLQHNPVAFPDTRIRTLVGIEYDLLNFAAASDAALKVVGIAMNYAPINGGLQTTDSAGIYMSGFYTGMVINYVPDGGVTLNTQAFNVLNWDSPAQWTGTPTTNLTWEAQNYVDASLLRLQCWTSRDSGVGGWPSASMHLGLGVDGTPLSLAVASRMAQIVWNPQGYQGGLQLQNQNGVPVLTIGNDAAPSVTLHTEIYGPTGAAYLQTLYATNTTRGGFVGSIQNAGTTPEVMGFWAQDGVLHLGIGAGDIPGTPNSTIASISSFGNLTISTISFQVLPGNYANDAGAAAGGVAVGGIYRSGSALMVRAA